MNYPELFQKHIIGVGAIVQNNDQVLLVKNTYGISKNHFVIPGGFVEAGETLEEAVIREVKEETNIEIDPIRIIGIRTIVPQDFQVSDVYISFICRVSKVTELVAQQEEIQELVWIEKDKIDNNTEISKFTRYTLEQAFSRLPIVQDHNISEERRVSRKILKNEQYWSSLR